MHRLVPVFLLFLSGCCLQLLPSSPSVLAPVPRFTPASLCWRCAALEGQVVEVEGEAVRFEEDALLPCRPIHAEMTTSVDHANRLTASALSDNRGIIARVSSSGPVVLRGRVAGKENGWVRLADATVVAP